MQFFLLDGVGAAFLLVLFGLGLLFIIIAILVEAAVMLWMKYILTYKTAFIHSLTVNVVSLAAGFILSGANSDLFQLNNMAGFGVMFAVTLLVEFLLLYFMNKTKPASQTALVCLVMNAVTYLVAFFFIQIL